MAYNSANLWIQNAASSSERGPQRLVRTVSKKYVWVWNTENGSKKKRIITKIFTGSIYLKMLEQEHWSSETSLKKLLREISNLLATPDLTQAANIEAWMEYENQRLDIF